MRVLAFDPGETTGFSDLVVEKFSATILDFGTFPQARRIESLINLALLESEDLCIVTEGYRNVLGFNPVCIEIVGVLRYLSGKSDQRLHTVRPGQSMRFIQGRFPHVLQKTLGSTHARDAICHGLYFAYHNLGVRSACLR